MNLKALDKVLLRLENDLKAVYGTKIFKIHFKNIF